MPRWRVMNGRSEHPLWLDGASETAFAPLDRDLRVDVAVVGGGVFGLTAAALLARAGRKVVLVEARRIGRQASGKTTAKLTTQHGLIYARLKKAHGADAARAYADANAAAMALVRTLVHDKGIACDLEPRDAYVYSGSAERRDDLAEEAECAREAGLEAEIVDGITAGGALPPGRALRFPDQAQLHPVKYLGRMAEAAAADGLSLFENTRAMAIDHGEPCRVETPGGTLTADAVIVATHLPVIGEGKHFAKVYPYTLPAVAAPLDPSRAPDGLYLSLDEPGISFIRTPVGGGTHLVAVGGACKPGHDEEVRARTAELEKEVQRLFGVAEISHRWTNQDYMPMDGMPFIGHPTSDDRHLYIGTGFNAWGLTNGTAAAMIVCDLILGRENPWAEHFDATRVTAASAKTFFKENAGVARHLIEGYAKSRPTSPEKLGPDEAGVFEVNGERVAAYRGTGGELHVVSAVCTHLKCVVGWNPVARTWDCHCHGSRFGIDGEVVSAPAVTPLARAQRS